jgi:hypothetical protein
MHDFFKSEARLPRMATSAMRKAAAAGAEEVPAIQVPRPPNAKHTPLPCISLSTADFSVLSYTCVCACARVCVCACLRAYV